MKRRVIFPPADYFNPKENTMTNQPAPINRPISDAERQLMLDLAVRVIADQSGIAHTSGICEACAISASVLAEFVDNAEVRLRGDNVHCYLDVGPNDGLVHATREWLTFHAEHPEAIDYNRHCRPRNEDDQ